MNGLVKIVFDEQISAICQKCRSMLTAKDLKNAVIVGRAEDGIALAVHKQCVSGGNNETEKPEGHQD